LPTSDTVTNETVDRETSSPPPVTSQDAQHSTCLTDTLALPVLEKHERPLDEGLGRQALLTGDGEVSAADDSGGTADGVGTVRTEKSFDDDDAREMPKLTLYA